jgi:hypothetical protein
MKILLMMIFFVVSFVTYLISPNSFKLQESDIVNSAVEMQGVSISAVNNEQSLNDDSDVEITDENIEPAVPAETPTAAPKAKVGAAPSEIFGEPKIEDSFERGSSGFGLSAGLNDDENIRIIALNNQLALEPKKNNGWISWRLRPPVINDGAAEMEFSFNTCARGDRTGILMHAKDYNSGQGYYFSLSCEGTVSILKDSFVLSTADARSVFKNSSGDINVITAVVQGNTLTAMLNGETLLTLTDDTYTEGFSGFFASPQGQNTLTMDIISFKEYYHEK